MFKREPLFYPIKNPQFTHMSEAQLAKECAKRDLNDWQVWAKELSLDNLRIWVENEVEEKKQQHEVRNSKLRKEKEEEAGGRAADYAAATTKKHSGAALSPQSPATRRRPSQGVQSAPAKKARRTF